MIALILVMVLAVPQDGATGSLGRCEYVVEGVVMAVDQDTYEWLGEP